MVASLSPELRRYVEEKVRSGQYPTADAVLADAIRQMKEYEENLAAVRAQLQIGLDQLDRGEGREWDVEAAEKRLTERLASANRAE